MKLLTIATCLLSLVFLSFSNAPTNTEWERQYNKNGLEIYTRTASDGIKEFKVITLLDAKMNTIVSVLADYENHPNWMDGIKKCELVQQVNTKNRYLYYLIPMPWPLSNRDIVSNSYFTKEGKTVKLNVKAAPNKKAETQCTRIKKAGGYWRFVPQKSGKIKLTYQYKADPVGIPSGIVGMFLVDGPRKTVTNFKKELLKSKYQNAKVDWLDLNE